MAVRPRRSPAAPMTITTRPTTVATLPATVSEGGTPQSLRLGSTTRVPIRTNWPVTSNRAVLTSACDGPCSCAGAASVGGAVPLGAPITWPCLQAAPVAPREPQGGLLLHWVTGALLHGVDPGHDGVDVHAAAGPGGLAAAGATGGTTHVVLLVVDR